MKVVECELERRIREKVNIGEMEVWIQAK